MRAWSLKVNPKRTPGLIFQHFEQREAAGERRWCKEKEGEKENDGGRAGGSKASVDPPLSTFGSEGHRF